MIAPGLVKRYVCCDWLERLGKAISVKLKQMHNNVSLTHSLMSFTPSWHVEQQRVPSTSGDRSSGVSLLFKSVNTAWTVLLCRNLDSNSLSLAKPRLPNKQGWLCSIRNDSCHQLKFLDKSRSNVFQSLPRLNFQFSPNLALQFFLLVMFQLILTSRSLLKVSCVMLATLPLNPMRILFFQVWLVCFSIYNIKD